MRIAVASDDGKNIAAHFGRCKAFVVYDVEGKEVKNRTTRANIYTSHSTENHDSHEEHRCHTPGSGQHSHGPVLAALSDCDVVISHGMGWRIAEDLRQNGIKAFVTNETVADKAVTLFLNNQLPPLEDGYCGCH